MKLALRKEIINLEKEKINYNECDQHDWNRVAALDTCVGNGSGVEWRSHLSQTGKVRECAKED